MTLELGWLWRDILAGYPTILLCGTPRAGKTTLSQIAQKTRNQRIMGHHIFHSDDHGASFERVANELTPLLHGKDYWLVEGVFSPAILYHGAMPTFVIHVTTAYTETVQAHHVMAQQGEGILMRWHQDNRSVPLLSVPCGVL